MLNRFQQPYNQIGLTSFKCNKKAGETVSKKKQVELETDMFCSKLPQIYPFLCLSLHLFVLDGMGDKKPPGGEKAIGDNVAEVSLRLGRRKRERER